MLEIKDLHVSYGAIKAIKGISISVPEKGIVTLIGANGAGKTTLLRTISSILKPESGSVNFNGKEIGGMPADKVVELGISQSPEGRMIFANLTVKENLEMGAYIRKDRENVEADYELVYSLFPRIKERLKQPGGTLSGGEQQMLAISRALMSRPKLLLLDEPSLGIAPILVKAIFEKIVELNSMTGITILLVEQNANIALSVANYAYVMETGKITLEGEAKSLLANEQVRKAYLGE
ncbi:MAG: ABC transporter ATP-binding protein [Ignavibacteria bacterium]|nr:ABC transporter ATP-binding protein [Ignavibacteria bacterium]